MLEDNPLWTPKRLAAGNAELGTYWHDRGNGRMAVRYLQAATVLDPTRDRYWNTLGAAYLFLSQLPQAEQAFRQALDRNPSNAKAWFNLGQICSFRGNMAGAVEAYERGCNAGLDDARCWGALARACFAIGRTDRGEEALKRLIRLTPNDPWALVRLGQLRRAAGDTETAVELYRRAVRAAPDNLPAHLELAHTLDGIPGREAEARTLWRRIAALAGQDPSRRAVLEEAQGRLRALGVTDRP
jgi:tetratricopeptide (TPR) repeat protein